MRLGTDTGAPRLEDHALWRWLVQRGGQGLGPTHRPQHPAETPVARVATRSGSHGCTEPLALPQPRDTAPSTGPLLPTAAGHERERPEAEEA